MVYQIPTVGDLVLARVEKISQSRGAECSVLGVSGGSGASEETPVLLGMPLRGTIRMGDVAAPGVQLEFADVANCFRPGDLVRAKVVSLGDGKGFFLSTVADNCGVLCGDFAHSRALSYKLLAMSDGSVHRRKLARPL